MSWGSVSSKYTKTFQSEFKRQQAEVALYKRANLALEQGAHNKHPCDVARVIYSFP